MKSKLSIAAFWPNSSSEAHFPPILILCWQQKKNQTCYHPPTRLTFLSIALSPHVHASAQFISNFSAIYFPFNLVCRDAVSSRISSERQWADAQGFPWSQILHSMLSECFRLHSFRPGQLEAINCVRSPHFLRTILVIFHFLKAFPNSLFLCLQVLSGNDVFLVMAAGAGKSLVCVISLSFFTVHITQTHPLWPFPVTSCPHSLPAAWPMAAAKSRS